MNKPTILGLATAVPEHQHAQMEIHDRWLAPYINSQRARSIFAAAQIDTRYSVLETSEFLAHEPGTKARNDLYFRYAPPLAANAIKSALAAAKLNPDDIDHLIVISCTGIDTPGLDVLLAARLNMRPDLRRSALIGMGCQAGLTGLDRAMLELAARPQNHVLVLALEFSTLHFQHGATLANLVADAIFGDGVAAVVMGLETPGSAGPRLIDTGTYSNYDSQELMGFHISDHGYKIHLATRVPKMLKAIVPDLVADFLARSGLSRSDIRFWGIHPGGAKIIDYIGQALALEPDNLRFTRDVLRNYGNMSSATVFFVLDKIMQQGHPQPDDYGLLLSFGPGLTIEVCLIQW